MKYRKKPVVIEAQQFIFGCEDAVADWCGGELRKGTGFGGRVQPYLLITTMEGTMRANIYDYVIRGVQGEFYPCKPDIFKATYEEAG